MLLPERRRGEAEQLVSAVFSKYFELHVYMCMRVYFNKHPCSQPCISPLSSQALRRHDVLL